MCFVSSHWLMLGLFTYYVNQNGGDHRSECSLDFDYIHSKYIENYSFKLSIHSKKVFFLKHDSFNKIINFLGKWIIKHTCQYSNGHSGALFSGPI